MEDIQTIVIETRTEVSNIKSMLEKMSTNNEALTKVAMQALNQSERNNSHFLRLEDEVKQVKQDKTEDHAVIWTKIDKHSDKLEEHSGKFKWLVGIGLGLQIAWAVIWKFVKPE